MKVFQTILGLIVFILLIIYQWLPFIGALSIIVGVVGFITGSDTAGRTLIVGIILLSIRYVIAFSFLHFVTRHSSSDNPSTLPQSSPNNSSKLPVEITDEDRRQYEAEEREFLKRYADDPTCNFSDTNSTVEQISHREAFIRALLSRSSYCHTFTQEECRSLIASYGLLPEDLPSIVDELNSRRAQMDCQERMFYHAYKAAPAT